MFCPTKIYLEQLIKGIHSYRVLNIAVVDVLLTIVSAYLVSKLFPYILLEIQQSYYFF